MFGSQTLSPPVAAWASDTLQWLLVAGNLFALALGVMAGTGLILSIGEPVRQATALSFWIKMSLIAIGVASALYFGRTVSAAATAADASYSGRARVVAVATIILWLAIIFFGRSIAYDVEIWESWHLA